MIKRIVSGSILCIVLLSMLVFTYNPVDASAYKKTFKDVSTKNVNYDIIHTMANRGVIGGYEDGTFRPGEYITRKHAAALISRSFPKLIKSYEWREMKDLSPSNAYYNDIKRLYESYLLDDEKGYIRPNEYLTRGEMARILAFVSGVYETDYISTSEFNHPFTDLRLPHNPMRIVINQAVAGLYNSGITTGYEDKTFRPHDPITRAQFAVFMYRANQNKHKNALYMYELNPFEYSSYEYVPLPTGIKDAESLLKKQIKVYGSFSYNNNFDYRAGKNMHSPFNYTYGHDLTRLSNNFKIEVNEVIRIINYVFTTGEVYTSPAEAPIPFAMYYDFTKGWIYYGSDPDPLDNTVNFY